jgi:hypothetical protein
MQRVNLKKYPHSGVLVLVHSTLLFICHAPNRVDGDLRFSQVKIWIEDPYTLKMEAIDSSKTLVYLTQNISEIELCHRKGKGRWKGQGGSKTLYLLLLGSLSLCPCTSAS